MELLRSATNHSALLFVPQTLRTESPQLIQFSFLLQTRLPDLGLFLHLFHQQPQAMRTQLLSHPLVHCCCISFREMAHFLTEIF